MSYSEWEPAPRSAIHVLWAICRMNFQCECGNWMVIDGEATAGTEKLCKICERIYRLEPFLSVRYPQPERRNKDI